MKRALLFRAVTALSGVVAYAAVVGAGVKWCW